MPDENAIMRETLSAIRLEIDARRLPLKVLAAKAGVSYSTFLSWFPAGGTPQVPSLACLDALIRALPDDLQSLLVPDGYAIVKVPEGLDHNEIAEGFQRYLLAKGKAHHPDSPAGPAIADCEREALDKIVVQLPIVRRRA